MSSTDLNVKALAIMSKVAARWSALSKRERASIVGPACLAIVVLLWRLFLAPGMAAFEKAQRAEREIDAAFPSTPVDARLVAERLVFEKMRRDARLAARAPSSSPEALSEIGAAAGAAFAGISVNEQAGWPQSGPGGWQHLVELRLGGDWQQLVRAINAAEPIVDGKATELAVDRSADGRVALRVRWIVISGSRDWGSSPTRLAPSQPSQP